MKGYDLKGEKDTAKEQRIPPRHGTFGEKIPPQGEMYHGKHSTLGERYQGENERYQAPWYL